MLLPSNAIFGSPENEEPGVSPISIAVSENVEPVSVLFIKRISFASLQTTYTLLPEAATSGVLDFKVPKGELRLPSDGSDGNAMVTLAAKIVCIGTKEESRIALSNTSEIFLELNN